MGQSGHGESGMHYSDALFFVGHYFEGSVDCDTLGFGNALRACYFDALV
jgi:hypothetical protein